MAPVLAKLLPILILVIIIWLFFGGYKVVKHVVNVLWNEGDTVTFKIPKNRIVFCLIVGMSLLFTTSLFLASYLF